MVRSQDITTTLPLPSSMPPPPQIPKAGVIPPRRCHPPSPAPQVPRVADLRGKLFNPFSAKRGPRILSPLPQPRISLMYVGGRVTPQYHPKCPAPSPPSVSSLSFPGRFYFTQEPATIPGVLCSPWVGPLNLHGPEPPTLEGERETESIKMVAVIMAMVSTSSAERSETFWWGWRGEAEKQCHWPKESWMSNGGETRAKVRVEFEKLDQQSRGMRSYREGTMGRDVRSHD